ncbi:MAG: hypothetical protein E6J14_04685 [Chloroflexi bacterium]|nr:MAG: hypothetical protein E6J14_04685 [Chloroflexota bacterium]
MIVPAERLDLWLAGFAERHGSLQWTATPEQVVVTGADGCTAECEVPFPPLAPDEGAPFAGLVAHACAERSVGVVLVRLGGYAVGVFRRSQLVASKVGSRPVHGRAAAGGWSQKRFARRREGQARVALEAAADAAARVVAPVAGSLDAVVTGGDRHAVEAVLGDARLGVLLPLRAGRLLDVPEPRQRTLAEVFRRSSAVRIRIVESPLHRHGKEKEEEQPPQHEM